MSEIFEGCGCLTVFILVILLCVVMVIGDLNLAEKCSPYKDLTIDKVPAECVRHFVPSRVNYVPIYMPLSR